MGTLNSISMRGDVRPNSIIFDRGGASYMTSLCEMEDLAMLQPCWKDDWYLSGWSNGVCMLRKGYWIRGIHFWTEDYLEALKYLELLKPGSMEEEHKDLRLEPMKLIMSEEVKLDLKKVSY